MFFLCTVCYSFICSSSYLLFCSVETVFFAIRHHIRLHDVTRDGLSSDKQMHEWPALAGSGVNDWLSAGIWLHAERPGWHWMPRQCLGSPTQGDTGPLRVNYKSDDGLHWRWLPSLPSARDVMFRLHKDLLLTSLVCVCAWVYMCVCVFACFFNMCTLFL